MPDSAALKVEAADADLQLQFAPSPSGRTYLSHQFSRYPFHICKAQYLDAEPSDMATVYLQSSAGGIFASLWRMVLLTLFRHVGDESSPRPSMRKVGSQSTNKLFSTR